MDSKNTPDSVELSNSEIQSNTSNETAPESSKVPETVFVEKDQTVSADLSDTSAHDPRPDIKASDDPAPYVQTASLTPETVIPEQPDETLSPLNPMPENLPEEEIFIPPLVDPLGETAAGQPVGRRRLLAILEQSPSRTILVSGMMIFILLIMFIAGIIQFDGTFILSDKTHFVPVNSDFLSRNRVFDSYRKTYTVSVSLEAAEPVVVSTQSVTIGELVERLYPDLGRDGTLYELSSDAYTIIENDMELAIDRIEFSEREEIREKEFTTQEIGLQTIPKGTVIVLQEGVNGSVRQKFRDKYVNGVLSDSFLISETVLVEPVIQIENVGTGGIYTTSGGKKYSYSYYVDVEATAYGVDTGYGGDNTHTKTGTQARPGVIAVDPEVIPFFSTVLLCYENGSIYGICYAEDAGYSIVDNRIDIYMGDDIERQTRFGRRKMRAYVLE